MVSISFRKQIDFRQLVLRLTKSSLAKNIAKLFAGNIAAQAILMLTAPIITRLYSPEDLGTMTLVTSVIMIFSVISCGRYERAIMLPKDNNEGEQVLLLCFFLNLVSCLFVFIIIIFGRDLIALALGDPTVAKWLWFVPAGVFFIGLRESLAYWYGRGKSFGLVSISLVHQALWAVLVKIVAASIYGGSACLLISGNIVGFFSSALSLLFRYGRERSIRSPALSKKHILAVAKKYKDFPVYSSWTGLINAFAENIPVFVLSYFYSPVIVGFFALANNMLRKPITLIANSITRVLLEKIAKLKSSNKEIKGTFVTATLSLAIIGILPFTIIFIYGPVLFSIFFGEQWEAAGEYSRILAPSLFFAFIMPPANQVITVCQQLKFNLIFHFVFAAVRFAALVTGAYFSDTPDLALWLFTIGSILLCIVYISAGMYFSQNSTCRPDKCSI